MLYGVFAVTDLQVGGRELRADRTMRVRGSLPRVPQVGERCGGTGGLVPAGGVRPLNHDAAQGIDVAVGRARTGELRTQRPFSARRPRGIVERCRRAAQSRVVGVLLLDGGAAARGFGRFRGGSSMTDAAASSEASSRCRASARDAQCTQASRSTVSRMPHSAVGRAAQSSRAHMVTHFPIVAKIAKKGESFFTVELFLCSKLENPFFCVSLQSLSSRIELWCNGNTSDFGSEIPGSNPGSSTNPADVRRGIFLLCRVRSDGGIPATKPALLFSAGFVCGGSPPSDV